MLVIGWQGTLDDASKGFKVRYSFITSKTHFVSLRERQATLQISRPLETTFQVLNTMCLGLVPLLVFFIVRVLDQRESRCFMVLQVRTLCIVCFLISTLWIPMPPRFLGILTTSQLTKCFFSLTSVCPI